MEKQEQSHPSRMRGLKRNGWVCGTLIDVASLADAWIKTNWEKAVEKSRIPPRMRGLKQRKNICYLNYFSVAPSGVRGLKCKGVKIYEKHNQQELS